MSSMTAEQMQENATEAAAFLKQLSNPNRLLVLCALATGERTATELSKMSGLSPSSLSQHLNKLRTEGLINYRREHRYLYYYLADANVARFLGLLYDIYCKEY
jgi:ArsR family transcriptional regulator